ncbi:uncharacterized protein LOC131160373 [Malania oleifera]|uniref:uncharacterized protein LOC131160373 n=1 Tax=Malania oleifera TaxID=397392 RepID=UPI0025AEBDA1|nr:uncharacterized protein LOC131160373 [Malania oleifera]
MEGPATGGRIERQSSIESEPRTLSIEQIQFAREAALYVMNTRSMEEALSIFTEGLQPVVSVAGRNVENKVVESSEGSESMNGIKLFGFRDVASAPF